VAAGQARRKAGKNECVRKLRLPKDKPFTRQEDLSTRKARTRSREKVQVGNRSSRTKDEFLARGGGTMTNELTPATHAQPAAREVGTGKFLHGAQRWESGECVLEVRVTHMQASARDARCLPTAMPWRQLRRASKARRRLRRHSLDTQLAWGKWMGKRVRMLSLSAKGTITHLRTIRPFHQ
jgi:hypothetical protein